MKCGICGKEMIKLVDGVNYCCNHCHIQTLLNVPHIGEGIMSEVVFENKGKYAISRESISIIANGDELLERLGYKKYKETKQYLRYRTVQGNQLDFDIINKQFRIRSRSGSANIFANYVDFDLAFAICTKIKELGSEEK